MSMLLFGVLRRSTMEIPDRDSARVTVRDSRSEELGRTGSGFQVRRVGADAAAEARLNITNHFVAKNFTNHIKLQAHAATIEKSDLTPSAQKGRAVQKRVVLD
jgi:hypothetical protein